MVNSTKARTLVRWEAKKLIPLTPHPSPLTPDSGFTLVEILVAMTIFAIAVLGLVIGATSVMRANQTSYFNTTATNLAQDKLEELKGMAVSALPSCPSYTSTGCSDSKTSLGLTFTRSWQIIANSPVSGVNRLDVKIDWTDYISHSLTISSAMKQ